MREMQSSFWSWKPISVCKTLLARVRNRLLNSVCPLLHWSSWGKNEMENTEYNVRVSSDKQKNALNHNHTNLSKKQAGQNPLSYSCLFHQSTKKPQVLDIAHHLSPLLLHNSVNSLIQLLHAPYPNCKLFIANIIKIHSIFNLYHYYLSLLPSTSVS